ncbi:MAG: flagellar hook-length control protein FliK [Methylocystis sp.]|nr:flagellar hook-length control protein FliK [Methylocystis sp.]
MTIRPSERLAFEPHLCKSARERIDAIISASPQADSFQTLLRPKDAPCAPNRDNDAQRASLSPDSDEPIDTAPPLLPAPYFQMNLHLNSRPSLDEAGASKVAPDVLCNTKLTGTYDEKPAQTEKLTSSPPLNLVAGDQLPARRESSIFPSDNIRFDALTGFGRQNDAPKPASIAQLRQIEKHDPSKAPFLRDALPPVSLATIETHLGLLLRRAITTEASTPAEPSVDAAAFDPQSAARAPAPLKILTLEMEPAHLGPLSVKIRMTDNRIAIEISTPSRETLDALFSVQERLQNTINATGAALDALSFSQSSPTPPATEFGDLGPALPNAPTPQGREQLTQNHKKGRRAHADHSEIGEGNDAPSLHGSTRPGDMRSHGVYL